MKNKIGIIFDFNGTLFQDGKYHVAAWKKISEELTNQAMSQEEIETKTHGVCNEVVIDRLSHGTLSKEENLAWSKRKEELYRQMVKADKSNAKLVHGAPSFFETLQQHKIPFTIASASIIENINFFFDFFHLNSWFDLKKVIYDDGHYIDKVAMFRDALNLINSEMEHTWIIEDSNSGYQCAVDAGFMHIIMICDSTKRQKEVSAWPYVDYALLNFNTIQEIFVELN